MRTMLDEPFGPAVTSVPLKDSPLRFVVAQIQFPLVTSIADEAFIGPFQERIRQSYADLRAEVDAQITIGPDGAQVREGRRIWRFTDTASAWEVTLAPEFLALATKTYTSRDDFLSRLGFLVEALGDWLRLRTTRRLGVRYIDRLDEDSVHLDDIAELLKPEVLGATQAPRPGSVALHHALADFEFRFADDTALRARWGSLPPHTSFDPAIEPIDGPSWVLDLDASHGEREFSPAAIRDQVQLFSDRIYRFFRWAITDEFLKTFGADL